MSLLPAAITTMRLECVIIVCGHGNHPNPVVSCAKFDAHTHCPCQAIRVPCIRGGIKCCHGNH